MADDTCEEGTEAIVAADDLRIPGVVSQIHRQGDKLAGNFRLRSNVRARLLGWPV